MSVSNGREPRQRAAVPAGVPAGQRKGIERSRPPMPVIHQIAWMSLVLQLVLVGFLIGAAVYFELPKPILTATAGYLALAALIRLSLTRSHRRGMHYARSGRLEEAAVQFQRSYEFFSRHRWLDEMRYLTLLSTSRICYREMALLNLAYCDLWHDRGEEAVKTYLRTIEEFPDSGLAWTGIKLFQQGGHDGERRAMASLVRPAATAPASATAGAVRA